MTKDSKVTHISDSASGGKGENMASEIREGRLRERAFILAEDFVRDYGRALPNDPHWKIAVEKTSGHIFRALVEVARISDETARNSEAQAGVGVSEETDTV